MKLNFMWIKYLWKAPKKDSTLELKSTTLLDLNEDCLRHIGYYLSIEDTYSLGHTCTQLFETVSKIRAIVTIEDPNDLKYLNYFGKETTTIRVDTENSTPEFTENDQKNLLTILDNCRKVTSLKLGASESRILGSAFFRRAIRKLAYLNIDLKEFRPNFVELMENCENLRDLTILYEDSSSSSDTVKELFATKFPKLKSVLVSSPYFVPLNTFLRHNSQLRCLVIRAPLFEEYLEAIALCQKLKRIDFWFASTEEELIPKLLILNKLPVLEYTSLEIYIPANEQMAPILQQIQSLKELHIICTLLEDFIQDIFQIPQITSLELLIFFFEYTLSEVINRLRYHEQNLYNLTKLDLTIDPIDSIICMLMVVETAWWITSNDLNEFIKFIIKCPRLESIDLPLAFPIHRFYKQLLKYEKNFGYHVRRKALYLTVVRNQWIPGYSKGRRTHNVIIRTKNGDEPDTSVSSIIKFAFLELFCELPSVLFCVLVMLIGKLIHVMQNIII